MKKTIAVLVIIIAFVMNMGATYFRCHAEPAGNGKSVIVYWTSSSSISMKEDPRHWTERVSMKDWYHFVYVMHRCTSGGR